MTLLINKTPGAEANASETAIVLDDLMLTTGLPTTGGSMMLENYTSLFSADVVARLEAAGFQIAGKANLGEFGADFLGESSYFGAATDEAGNLALATSELLAGRADDLPAPLAVVGLDVNGAARRSAALSDQVAIKPSYGIVSRYGTIAIACSGEAVSVNARTSGDAAKVLAAIAGHDDKDGTSLAQEDCARALDPATRPIRRVALAKTLIASADEATQERIGAFAAFLEARGVEVAEIDDSQIALSNIAWNILLAAELCNNVSRFDGVKYGYRTRNFTDIDELYTNSRTEAFGDYLKALILFGSETLSTEKYASYYDKSLRVRRVVSENFESLFTGNGPDGTGFDAVLLPACAKTAYAPEELAANKYLALEENRFTAPASLTGLPALVVGGVQLIGPFFADGALLDLARTFETEAK